jgi:glycosyltransferase involved in cell wall biosynthesis
MSKCANLADRRSAIGRLLPGCAPRNGNFYWHSVRYRLNVRKPRVLQLVLSLAPGGTERLVVEICRQLADRVESTVCCLDEKGKLAAEVEELGIPVVALGRQPGFHPSLARRIAAIIKERHIDVVHCHQYSPYVYGLLASLITRVRLVYTEHGRLTSEPIRKRQLVNPLLALLPGRICAVSAALKGHMVREGFPAHCIRVVHNGIDPGARITAGQRRVVRASLGLPDDAYVAGTAGRLVTVKNVPVMLQAHALLRRSIPSAHLVVVGDGPERAALEQQALALGIAGAVTFTGYRSDVRNVMAALDVYLNSSLYEGVSLTILEAMAGGLPVIASPVGGNPEVVIDRETGYLIPSRPQAIADGLARLAHDERQRRVMGDAARWRVIRHFSIARMVDEYAAAYRGEAHHAAADAPASVPTHADTISVNDATRSAV